MFSNIQINEQEHIDNPELPLDLRKKLLLDLDDSNNFFFIYKIILNRFSHWLKKDLGNKKTLKILEIGSGSAGLAREMLTYFKGKIDIDYHIMDLDPEILSWAKENRAKEGLKLTTHVSGNTHLKQFSDEEFDIILSLHTVHHIHPMNEVQSFFQDVKLKSKYGFFIIDFERKRSNIITFYIGKFIGNLSDMLWIDGLRSLRRSYSRKEFFQFLKNSAEWKIRFKSYFWNPYIIISAVKN